MKNPNKYILPFLVLAIIGAIYFIYFSPFKGLGSFSDFDPNSHAQKEIKVKLVHELGIHQAEDGTRVYFTAEDKTGRRMRIEAPHPLPEYFHDQTEALLTGHLHGDLFAATSVSF